MKTRKTSVYRISGKAPLHQDEMRLYSKMKYGVSEAIDSIGERLYEQVVESITKQNKSDVRMAFIVIYKQIPSSSYYLTKYVVQNLRANISQNNGSVSIIKGHRLIDNLDGFSTMDYRERVNYKTSDVHFSEVDLSRITPNTDLFIIDDIHIAGTFTQMVSSRLKKHGYPNTNFIYFASVDEDVLTSEPFYEHKLNSTEIKSLSDTQFYVNSGQMLPTRKFAKLLIKANETELDNFFSNLTSTGEEFIKILIGLIVENDFTGEYIPQINSLTQRITQRNE